MKISIVLSLFLVALAVCSHPQKHSAKLTKVVKHQLQAKIQTAVKSQVHDKRFHEKHMLKKNTESSKKSLRLRMKGGDNVYQTIIEKVCVKGNDVKATDIPYLTKAIRSINKLRFTHISGQIQCKKNSKKNFGCKDYGVGIYVLSNDKVLSPNFGYDDKIIKIEKNGDGDKTFWRIDNAKKNKNPDTYEQKLDHVTIEKSDLLQTVYSEVFFKKSTGDNGGTTCFKIEAKYDPTDNSQFMGYDETLIGENICVDPKKKEPMPFPAVKEEIKDITKIILNHRSGKVGCNQKKDTNFGCSLAGTGYGIMITNKNALYAPDFAFDNKVKVTNESNGNKMFWTIDNLPDGFRAEYAMNKAKISPGDKIGAVYSEGFYSSTQDDNQGETCFDVWVQYKKYSPEEIIQQEEAAAKKKLEDEAAAKKLEDEAAAKKLEDDAKKQGQDQTPQNNNDNQVKDDKEEDC